MKNGAKKIATPEGVVYIIYFNNDYTLNFSQYAYNLYCIDHDLL